MWIGYDIEVPGVRHCCFYLYLGKLGEIKALYDATYNCLIEVHRLNMTSLAFSLLTGTGDSNIPADVSTTVMLNAISDFAFKQRNTSVAVVTMVEVRAPAAESVARAVADAFVDVQLCKSLPSEL